MNHSVEVWQPPIKEVRGEVYISENDFRETLVRFLTNSQHVMQVVTDRKHSYLTVIKVCQAVLKTKGINKSISISKDGSTLYANWNSLSPAAVYIKSTIESNSNLKLLIINCTPRAFIKNNTGNLSQVCEFVYKKGRKTILISEEFIEPHSLLKHNPHSVQHVKDLGFTFNQLSDETKKKCLKKKLIIFQGSKAKISFSELIVAETPWSQIEAAKQIMRLIDFETLFKLIKNEQINIGKAVQEYQIVRYIYLRRTVKVIAENKEVLLDKFFLTEEELLKCNSKFVVIMGGEGMGTSALMNNLLKGLKRNNPTMWICRLNLNNYLKEFRMEYEKRKRNKRRFGDDVNEAKIFLTQCLLKNKQFETSFEEKLFRLGFERYIRLALIFDGFDEICMKYKEIIVELFLSLQKTNVEKVYVTSRPSPGKLLEKKINGLYLEIQPFSTDDQLTLFTKFWSGSDPDGKEILQNFHKISDITRKEKGKDYLGNPLTLLMFAECCREYVNFICSPLAGDFKAEEIDSQICQKITERFFSQEINYWRKQFINSKLSLYQTNKRRDDKGKVRISYKLDYYINVVRNAHLHLGLINIFGPQIATELTEEELWIIKYLQKELPKVGLICRVSGIYHFIHKSFAEQFSVDFIINNPHRAIRLCENIGWESFFDVFSVSNRYDIIDSMVRARFDIYKNKLVQVYDEAIINDIIKKMENFHSHVGIINLLGKQTANEIIGTEEVLIDEQMKKEVLKIGFIKEDKWGKLEFSSPLCETFCQRIG